MGSIHGKNRGRKFRDTAPLRNQILNTDKPLLLRQATVNEPYPTN